MRTILKALDTFGSSLAVCVLRETPSANFHLGFHIVAVTDANTSSPFYREIRWFSEISHGCTIGIAILR